MCYGPRDSFLGERRHVGWARVDWGGEREIMELCSRGLDLEPIGIHNLFVDLGMCRD